jgi:hypothetical protein
MKKTLPLIVFFIGLAVIAQPKIELTPNGFASVEIVKPDKPFDKLIEISKNWGYYYNKKGHDVYDVTANSLKIDAVKKNAFFFRNLGQEFVYDIKYTLEIAFYDHTYKLLFYVKEIYTHNKLTESTVADYFTSEGKLKEDFEEVKPSLEKTANGIIRSFSDYIAE